MLKELKDNDHKQDKDLSRMESRLDLALSKIKALINGMTIQHNELRSQLSSRDNENQLGLILGNPTIIRGEVLSFTRSVHNNRYGTKLEFPRFGVR